MYRDRYCLFWNLLGHFRHFKDIFVLGINFQCNIKPSKKTTISDIKITNKYGKIWSGVKVNIDFIHRFMHRCKLTNIQRIQDYKLVW